MARSILEAKINRTKVIHQYCPKFIDWHTMWPSIKDIILYPNCLLENLKLIYDSKLNIMVNPAGIDIKRFGEFGSLSSIISSNLFFTNFLPYFDNLIHFLKEALNLSSLDVFAAGYDYRDIGDKRKMTLYFKNLSLFIEKNYKYKRNKFIFVSHSMGGCLISRFLSIKTAKWKKKYIDSWYSINAPFGGSYSAVLTHFGGMSDILISQSDLRKLATSFPSTYYMFPDRILSKPGKIIVSSLLRNYTIEDLKELIYETDITNISKILDHIEYPYNEGSPGVDMICAYGYGMKTVSKIFFQGRIGQSDMVYEYQDGDSVVTTDSLSLCKNWNYSKKHLFKIVTFNKAEHSGILSDQRLLSNFYHFIVSRMKKQQK